MSLKIITHKNPDLDAIGFVYSARKKFGRDIGFELVNAPSLQQLKMPEIIVGDVGVDSHPELGYKPSLSNFDHHYGAAERSATYLFNRCHSVLSKRLVDYIDEVDTGESGGSERKSLKVVVAGVRVMCNGEDNKIIEEGCKLFDWMEDTDADPYHLTSLPSHLMGYLERGLQEIERIEREIEASEICISKKNRRIGYLISTCPIKSLVKEEMFARGIDIAIIHYPSKQTFSIGCNLQTTNDVDLEKEVASELNCLEKKKGMPKEYTWGGHPDRIGSSRERGSLLTKDKVVEVIQQNL